MSGPPRAYLVVVVREVSLKMCWDQRLNFHLQTMWRMMQATLAWAKATWWTGDPQFETCRSLARPMNNFFSWLTTRAPPEPSSAIWVVSLDDDWIFLVLLTKKKWINNNNIIKCSSNSSSNNSNSLWRKSHLLTLSQMLVSVHSTTRAPSFWQL